jgi:protein-tyrosine phosphatase
MPDNEKIRVLFVCTGNICRSPTAEGVFVHYVDEAGLGDRIAADSAGTHGYHIGDPPDPRSIRMAASRGVDIAAQRARKVTGEDFDAFDYIVAMDTSHLNALEQMRGGGKAKLALLLPYGDSGRKDVPDPYYLQERAFAEAFDLIENGILGFLAHLRLNHQDSLAA